ncbi:MAG: hypothetical protein HZA53_13320 [Planctomycetes bacterium]|nr:hypothetical protein [Planctomycetota bacterium]
MKRALSNARRGAGERWAVRGFLVLAGVLPLGLAALPARELALERARFEHLAAAPRATPGPRAETRDLAAETARLAERIERLRPARLDPLEARTLLALLAREQALALEGVDATEAGWTVRAAGTLAQWSAYFERLDALRLGSDARTLRFERAEGGAFHGRVELRLGVSNGDAHGRAGGGA